MKNSKKTKDLFSSWARPTLETLCYLVGYEKSFSRGFDLREHTLADNMRKIFESFFKLHSYSREMNYQKIINDDVLYDEYKKILSKKSKNREILDIYLKGKDKNKYPNYLIEIKRFMQNQEDIENDVCKISDLIRFLREKKPKEHFRGFVLLISQKEVPEFVINKHKLVSDKKLKKFYKKKNLYTYVNRVTCKVISRNISSIGSDTEKEPKGIFASLLEVEVEV